MINDTPPIRLVASMLISKSSDSYNIFITQLKPIGVLLVNKPSLIRVSRARKLKWQKPQDVGDEGYMLDYP